MLFVNERFKESKFHPENSYLIHSCLDLNGMINVQDVSNRDLVLALFSWDIRVIESPVQKLGKKSWPEYPLQFCNCFGSWRYLPNRSWFMWTVHILGAERGDNVGRGIERSP